MQKKEIILTIFEEFYQIKPKEENAFKKAFHPIFDYLFNMCPNSLLKLNNNVKLAKELIEHIKNLCPNKNIILVDNNFSPNSKTSIKQITNELMLNIDKIDFGIINYPSFTNTNNNLKESIKIIELLDEQLEIILNYVIEHQDEITWFIIINHKNENSNFNNLDNLITFISNDKTISLKDGKSEDIIPTILDYLDILKPKEMKGNSLIIKKE